MPRSKSAGLDPEEGEKLRTDRLLDLAAEVFLELGYEGTSTALIAERAHASKQTFYARFPSKEKLFLAVIDRKLDEVFQRFQSLLHPEGSVREVLLDFGKVALEVLLAPEHVALARIVQMEANRFPEIGKSFYKNGPGRGLKQLAGYFREQSRRGTLAIEDPELASEHFLDLVTGGFLRKMLLGVDEVPSKKLQRYKVQAAIEVFLRAYCRVEKSALAVK